MPRAGFKLGLRVNVYLNLTPALTQSTTRAGLRYCLIQVKFLQKKELEGTNNGLVIIDVHLKLTYRILGVYRINFIQLKNNLFCKREKKPFC